MCIRDSLTFCVDFIFLSRFVSLLLLYSHRSHVSILLFTKRVIYHFTFVTIRAIIAVSYTHLAFQKSSDQVILIAGFQLCPLIFVDCNISIMIIHIGEKLFFCTVFMDQIPVSYTHLDVYKRQPRNRLNGYRYT